jgi:hypothetical protein
MSSGARTAQLCFGSNGIEADEGEQVKIELKSRGYQVGTGRGRSMLVGLALLGSLGCSAEPDAAERDVAERGDGTLASIELEDGNVVEFERLGDIVVVSETGLASNGSHLTGLDMKPVDVFRHLAPGRTVPDALLADDERTTYSQEVPADAVIASSWEEFEELTELDAEQRRASAPAPREQRAEPIEPPAASPTDVALGQRAAAQVAGNACDTFVQTQCILDTAGLFAGPPDDIVVATNIRSRIDDTVGDGAKRGHHSVCAAGENARIAVSVPDFGDLGTSGFEIVGQGSFRTITWETPRDCSRGGGRTVCFQPTAAALVQVVSESFFDSLPPASDGIHYCRAYDSN